jgi:rhomboid family GlyGly-CTERM serine protease
MTRIRVQQTGMITKRFVTLSVTNSTPPIIQSPPKSPSLRAWLLPPLAHSSWWLFGLAVLAMVLLQLAHQFTEPWLQYDRSGILAGQWWRLLTGHWVHFNVRHLVLNIAGMMVMVWLFAGALTRRQLLCAVLLSTAMIDAGMLLWMPDLHHYVGLSGVLHGVLAAGCIAWWRSEPRLLAGALTAVLVGKLLWEQLYGELPLAGEMTVIVNAHLYGAIGGALCGLVGLATSLIKRLRPAARA